MQLMAAKQKFLPPFHWVPEHNNEAGVRLQGVNEVLDKKRRLSLCVVVIEIHPGIVIPHCGSTGFSYKIHPQLKLKEITERQNKTHVQTHLNYFHYNELYVRIVFLFFLYIFKGTEGFNIFLPGKHKQKPFSKV